MRVIKKFDGGIRFFYRGLGVCFYCHIMKWKSLAIGVTLGIVKNQRCDKMRDICERDYWIWCHIMKWKSLVLVSYNVMDYWIWCHIMKWKSLVLVSYNVMFCF